MSQLLCVNNVTMEKAHVTESIPTTRSVGIYIFISPFKFAAKNGSHCYDVNGILEQNFMFPVSKLISLSFHAPFYNCKCSRLRFECS